MVRMASRLGFRKRGFGKLVFLILPLLLVPFRTTKAADVTSTLMIGGSRIDVTIQSSDTPDAPLSQTDVMKWVQMAAESVATYYTRFPVPHLTLRVISFDGDRRAPRHDVGPRRRLDRDPRRKQNHARRVCRRLDADARNDPSGVSFDDGR